MSAARFLGDVIQRLGAAGEERVELGDITILLTNLVEAGVGASCGP